MGQGIFSAPFNVATAVDNSTIEVSSGRLRVKDAGIAKAKLGTDVPYVQDCQLDGSNTGKAVTLTTQSTYYTVFSVSITLAKQGNVVVHFEGQAKMSAAESPQLRLYYDSTQIGTTENAPGIGTSYVPVAMGDVIVSGLAAGAYTFAFKAANFNSANKTITVKGHLYAIAY